MASNKDIQRELNKLKNNTGIKFDFELNNTNEKDLLNQLIKLNKAYEEKYNIDYFLENLLKGSFDGEYIKNTAKEYGIPVDEKYYLFLLKIKDYEETPAKEILKELFPGYLHNYIVKMNDNLISVIYAAKDISISEVIMQVKDMLNTEAMIPVRIAYSAKASLFDEISMLYEKALRTLNIGNLFGNKDDIYVAENFGLEELICDLSGDASNKFLNSIQGRFELENFDPELIHTIECFWDNNLNIAETSRKVHMHRNTLIYRIEHILKKTGLDVRKFDDSVKLKLAIMLMKYKKTGGKLHE